MRRISKNPVSIAQKKCDKVLQELGRKKYKECEVCGKPISCLHHFFPKSISSRLRYEWDNLIPICVSCHFQHHTSYNPSIHATIIIKRGQEWYDRLNNIKRDYVKTNLKYYQDKLEELLVSSK